MSWLLLAVYSVDIRPSTALFEYTELASAFRFILFCKVESALVLLVISVFNEFVVAFVVRSVSVYDIV